MANYLRISTLIKSTGKFKGYSFSIFRDQNNTQVTAADAIAMSVGGSVVKTQADCRSFAIGRFGGLGLGLLVSVVSVLMF
jgi:hypothetical protein